MTNDTSLPKEYVSLREHVLNGTASAAQVRELETMVLASTDLTRDFAEHIHQQAALGQQRDGRSECQVTPPASTPNRQGHRYVAGLIGVGALAAAMLMALGAHFVRENLRKEFVGTLASTDNCQWGETSLPTQVGARLTKGRLKLNAGIAVVNLGKVNVTLEGPAEFEILSQTRCMLHSGRVFSEVRKGGEGFVIQTPTAVLTDHGTVFGVTVGRDGISNLRVFEGHVEARTIDGKHRKSLYTNGSASVTATGIEQGEPADFRSDVEISENEKNLRLVDVTTATGTGDDAYLRRLANPPTGTPRKKQVAQLLAKKSNQEEPGWDRKIMLRFDLSMLGDAQIETAKLRMYGVATEIGFASCVPDSTFTVLGVTNEAQEDWHYGQVEWDSTSVWLNNTFDLVDADVVELGSFIVPMSQPTGFFGIDGERLVEFLKSDTNGTVTLVVIRDTSEIKSGGYVHGFASRRHPDAPAPAIRLGLRMPETVAASD